MARAVKIDDVKKKSAPAPTSRPILVSDASEAPSDPMLASHDASAEAPTAPLVVRSVKTIQPLDSTLKASEDSEPEEPVSKEEPEAKKSESKEPEAKEPEMPAEEKLEKSALAPEEKTPESEPTKDAAEAVAPKGIIINEPRRDTEAEVSAEEAAVLEAQVAREQELESLIASGKYNVPIDAIQRKRSRMYTILLVIVALALAVVLIDAVFDASLVSVPDSIPHTHFFSSH